MIFQKQLADVPAKAAHDKDGWQKVIASAEATTPGSGDRLLCGAAVARVGLLPGFTHKKTLDQYRDQAIADLMACPLTGPQSTSLTPVNSYMAPACGYSWLRERLTDDQKATLLAKYEAKLAARPVRPEGTWAPGVGNGWASLNLLSAQALPLAVAIADDVPHDPVSLYLGNAGEQNAPRYNMRWCLDNRPDGGWAEGHTYLDVLLMPLLAMHTPTVLTPDQGDLLFWFEKFPEYLLNTLDPRMTKGTDHRCLPAMSYMRSEEMGRYAMKYAILAACTGSSNPTTAALARWLLDQARGYHAHVTGGNLLLCCYLIGDPRVVGTSPQDLGLPLEKTFTGAGHWKRASWDRYADTVFFGAPDTRTRTWPANELMLWSGGRPITGYRGDIWEHHYGPDYLRNVVVWYSGDKQALRLNSTSTPVSYHKIGEFRAIDVASVRSGTVFGKSAGEPAYVRASSQVPTLDVAGVDHERSVCYGDRCLIVTDTMRAPAALGLTPHVCWNAPTGLFAEMSGDGIDKWKTIGGAGHEADTWLNGPSETHISGKLQYPDGGWRWEIVPKQVRPGEWRLVTTIRW